MTIKKIRKRDGNVVLFQKEKIANAIWKAVKAVGGQDRSRTEQIADIVVEKLGKKYGEFGIPEVEEVQDLVEKILIEEGHAQVAKAYILYRKSHDELRNVKGLFDTIEVIDDYVGLNDWMVKENSNMGFSLQGLNNYIADKIIKNYWMRRVYPEAIRKAHENVDLHIHDLGCLAAYCVGWDLKDLLMVGFKGVAGKVESKPAKHFRTALGQIVNFFYTLQGESAGAQAFSNFDTLLAPFIRYDNLDYNGVKQAMQEFLFNLAVPTRVGFQCMSEDTEILTPLGWKKYFELNEGDVIKTFNIKTKNIEDKPIKHLFSRHYEGEMYNLKNRIQDQLISPKHRIVRKKFQTNEYILEEVEKVEKMKSPFIIPIAGENIALDINLKDNMIKLLAWIIAEGTMENFTSHRHSGRITIYQSAIKNLENYKEIVSLLDCFNFNYSERDSTPGFGQAVKMMRLNAGSSHSISSYFKNGIKCIPDKLLNMSKRQSRLFLDVYLKADGFEDCKIATTNEKVLDGLQQIAVNAGYGFTVLKREPIIGTKPIFVLRLIKHNETYIQKIEKINYKGIIWCPNTDNETVIARRKGKVFITGNTPFTNITMDLKVPEHMKKEHIIIGGQAQKEIYSEFQEEMDILNKAFAECMLQGDASGRVFTFPIPTYNITKDFDWDNKNYDLIWEMTAKYGIPYFSNFINSDMKPEDARSMCLHGDEEIIVRINNKIQRTTMEDLVETYGGEDWNECNENIEAIALDEKYHVKWERIKNFLKAQKQGMRIIKTRDGKFSRYSLNHPILVLQKEGFGIKFAKDIQAGDYMLSLKSAENVLSKEKQNIGDYEFNEDMAFLLGFFTADGNYLYKSGKTKLRGLQFTFNSKNEKLIEKIKKLIKLIFNYEAKEKKDPRYNTYYLYIYNSNLAELLYHMGFKKYGRLSDIVFNSSREVIELFLEGFFCGDGYEKRKEIHINDNLLIRDLTILYSLLGIPNILKIRKKSQILYLQHKHGARNKINQTVSCINELVPGFLAKSTFLVPGLIKSRMVGQSTLQKYGAETEISKMILSSNIYPIRVTEIIENDNIENFYDIELEKNHKFVHSLGTITNNCCRLRLDQTELRKRGGGLFGSHPLTGSIGVVTINMPRLGFISANEEEYFRRLKELMELAKESLEIKRKAIEKFTEIGLYPYSKFYLRSIKQRFGEYWKNHFSTIGLLGMNESIMNFMPGESIVTPRGRDFALKVLEFMRNHLEEYQKETGNIYNLEATPGEGTTYRFAREDKKKFGRIIVANEEAVKKGGKPFYTNSTQLPVSYTDDLFEALEMQDELQIRYTGGTTFHAFIGEKLNKEGVKILIKKVAENFKMPYFTLTPTFSICPIHGYLAGEHEYCPKCDEELNPAEIKDLNKIKEVVNG